MSRLFTRQGNPNLTSRRRHEIYLDILERPSPEERDLVETIHVERVVPGILRSVAVRAFPEGRSRPRRPDSCTATKHPHSITSSTRRCKLSIVSSTGVLLLINPSTTPFSFGTKRSGAKSPARGVSYSSRKWFASARAKKRSATHSYPPSARWRPLKLPRHMWMPTTTSLEHPASAPLIESM